MPAGRMILTAKSHETYTEVASTFCRSISWGPFVLAQQEILEISRFNFQYLTFLNMRISERLNTFKVAVLPHRFSLELSII